MFCEKFCTKDYRKLYYHLLLSLFHSGEKLLQHSARKEIDSDFDEYCLNCCVKLRNWKFLLNRNQKILKLTKLLPAFFESQALSLLNQHYSQKVKLFAEILYPVKLPC